MTEAKVTARVRRSATKTALVTPAGTVARFVAGELNATTDPSPLMSRSLALASAVLFGASAPFAKLLLDAVDAQLLAGLLYLGAVGRFFVVF